MRSEPEQGRTGLCRAFAAKVSQYAEGDLGAQECARFEDHLEVCGRCRHVLELHRRMVLLLESSREIEAPWDMDLRVLEALGFGPVRGQLRGSRVSPPVVWAVTAAVIAVVGAGGLAVRHWVARAFTALFDASGQLHPGTVADLAGRVVKHVLVVWEALIGGIGALGRAALTLSPVLRENPLVIVVAVSALLILLVFVKSMAQGQTSKAMSDERRSHAGR